MTTGAMILSLPNWANGFGLPSVPSGISVMLESRKLLKAGSEKIESSNVIFLTLDNKARKSSLTVAEISFGIFAVAGEPSIFGRAVPDGEETRLGSSGEGFIKKI